MAADETIRETDWASFTAAVSAAQASGAQVTVMTGEPEGYVALVVAPPAGDEEE
jgi:hypothetical protein